MPKERTEALCLTDEHLAQLHALATRCEEVYGKARDIEWALADDTIYLFQCRAVTTSTQEKAAIDPMLTVAENDPAELVPEVPLFAGLSDAEIAEIAALFKARKLRRGRRGDPRRLRRRGLLPDRLGRSEGHHPR